MYNFKSAFESLSTKSAKAFTLLWGLLCYLIEPDAAFMAVWLAVLMDLLTKLVAIAAQKGGLVIAIKDGHITSRRAFLGTFVKLSSYFALGVMATQAKYVATVEVASVLARTVVFAFLFTVEAVSILENLLDTGLTRLEPLLRALNKAGGRQ
jgi:phage-related holin